MVAPRILAYRPAGVVGRLAPRSAACPLSLRELLGPAAALGLTLPLVRAPHAAVARGALVAARSLGSALGLALPAGQPPAPWFDAVTRAADELAGALPIFLAGEVVLAGEAFMHVDAARDEAARLVGAGLTHLAVDVASASAPERARILAEVARGADAEGISVECVISLREGAASIRGAAALLEELAGLGLRPDLASVRCRAPASAGEARLQLETLERLGAALGGLPVLRRGPGTPGVLGLLAGSAVRACEDGGAVARGLAGAAGRAPAGDAAERHEARAWVGTSELIEGLRSSGSARGLARALEARLVDGAP